MWVGFGKGKERVRIGFVVLVVGGRCVGWVGLGWVGRRLVGCELERGLSCYLFIHLFIYFFPFPSIRTSVPVLVNVLPVQSWGSESQRDRRAQQDIPIILLTMSG